MKASPPFVHSYIAAHLIRTNGSASIAPKRFAILLGVNFRIKKEYSIIVLKELQQYGLIEKYNSEKIVINKKACALKVFMDGD